MKANPCRYCFFAAEFPNGRHTPSYGIVECQKCKNRKQHKSYLESKRKYKPGPIIKTLSELLAQTWVIIDYVTTWKTTHVEAIKSTQLRVVLKNLEYGRYHYAVENNPEKPDEA